MFAAVFLDGKSAQRRPVRVTAAVNRIRIVGEDGCVLDEWPLDGVRLAWKVYPDRPVRLKHQDRGEATLTLERPVDLAALEALLPHLRGRLSRRRTRFSRLLMLSMAVVILIGGMAKAVPYLAAPLARAVPMSWQRDLSDAAVASFGGEDKMCAGAAGRAALSALVARMTAALDTPHRFEVSVLDRPGVNAFATPAVRIVFFRGLIATAGSPEEVAGVLAHEMAHVVKRHPMEGLIRSLGFGLVFGLLTGETSGPASALGQVGQTLVAFSYGREKESEADRIGMEILNRAGIRSDGLPAFFERLKAQGHNVPGALSFLSTHPLHEDRIAAIRSLARDGEAAMSPRQWRAVRRICGKSL